MDSKLNMVKPISSNSTIVSADVNKCEKWTNKKCLGIGERDRPLKKRGVYVENKTADLTSSRNEQNNTIKTRQSAKQTPKIRRESKRLRAAILLSKISTGTQCLKGDEKINDYCRKNKRNSKVTNNNDTKSKRVKLLTENSVNIDSAFKTGKRKFTSIYLDKPLSTQQLVIQPKKDILQTAMVSECSRCKHDGQKSEKANFDESVNSLIEYDIFSSDNTSGVIREVFEGKKIVDVKRSTLENPSTLIKSLNLEENIKDDAELYNFFVDLLKITYSVYNVKTEYDVATDAISDDGQSQLKINEPIANNLIIKNDSNLVSNLNEDNSLVMDSLEYDKTGKKVTRIKKKNKVDSFIFPQYMQLKMHSRSAHIIRRKPSKKVKKKNLLGILKEQLRIEVDFNEEPSNLYQALKAIARNKQKTKNILHFKEPEKRKKSNGNDPECMLKRIRVFPSVMKSRRQNRKIKAINNYENLSTYANQANLYDNTREISKEENTKVIPHKPDDSLDIYRYDHELKPNSGKIG